MHHDFLGSGVAFPIHVSGTAVAMTEAERNVRQCLWVLLSTAPGERVMRPDFGCGIHRLVFATADVTTEGKIVQEVTLAINLWEPRVDVVRVEPKVRGNGTVVLVDVHYRVRSTNNMFNLVYPFYLDRSPA